MKTITSTISGLASSLFLNVGCTHIAQKLDPVSRGHIEPMQEAMSVALCAPSQFAPKPTR